MKITFASKSTNPAKFILACTTSHFRTSTSFLDQYLTTGTISYPITSTIFSPLTEFIYFFTGRTFTMIILLASPTHYMITYITLDFSALYPRTKYASKATTNKSKKLTKAIIRGTNIFGKFTSTITINFL